MRRTLAVVGLVALIGAVVAFGLWRRAQAVEVVPLHPPVEASAWVAYLERVAALDPGREEVVVPLLQAFAALNAAEVASADPERDAGYAAAARAWVGYAAGFVERRGVELYLDVGRRQGMRLAEKLAALLAWCDARGVAPGEAARMVDPPAVVRDYVAVGGGFVRFAEAGGLLRDGRLVEARLPFVQALFMEHWVAPLRGRAPVDEFMWPVERMWLLRWRVEYQPGGSVEEKVAAADELRVVAGYPSDLNAGVVLFRAGRFAEAARRFGRSTHPRAIAYRRMAERAAAR
ncbi:MAG: hypothetical protein R3F65_08185 [bacterium]